MRQKELKLKSGVKSIFLRLNFSSEKAYAGVMQNNKEGRRTQFFLFSSHAISISCFLFLEGNKDRFYIYVARGEW